MIGGMSGVAVSLYAMLTPVYSYNWWYAWCGCITVCNAATAATVSTYFTATIPGLLTLFSLHVLLVVVLLFCSALVARPVWMLLLEGRALYVRARLCSVTARKQEGIVVLGHDVVEGDRRLEFWRGLQLVVAAHAVGLGGQDLREERRSH